MKKKILKAMGIVMGIFIIIQLVSGPCFALELKLAHSFPQTHPIHKSSELFKKIVEEKTKGEVKIIIYPADTFATVVESLGEVMRGTLDMYLQTTGAGQTQIPKLAALILPFDIEDQAHANRIWSGPGLKRVREVYEENGIKVHYAGPYGFRQMTNNKRPIYKADDLKGLKMRTPPEIQYHAMYKALGAMPATVSFGELYLALSQGVTDGQCNPVWTINAGKFNEVQKYLAITNHCYNAVFIMKSLKRFESLPPDAKKAIEEADKAAMDYLEKVVSTSEQEILQSFEKRGLQITKPDRKSFMDKAALAHSEIARYAGEKWFNEWMGYVEAARKK